MWRLYHAMIDWLHCRILNRENHRKSCKILEWQLCQSVQLGILCGYFVISQFHTQFAAIYVTDHVSYSPWKTIISPDFFISSSIWMPPAIGQFFKEVRRKRFHRKLDVTLKNCHKRHFFHPAYFLFSKRNGKWTCFILLRM